MCIFIWAVIGPVSPGGKENSVSLRTTIPKQILRSQREGGERKREAVRVCERRSDSHIVLFSID